jgi:hypothetical protein
MPTIPTSWLVNWAIIAGRHVACGAVDRDRRNRVLVLLHAGATMTCAAISYFTAVLGALVGFFVANLFHVGGRS